MHTNPNEGIALFSNLEEWYALIAFSFAVREAEQTVAWACRV
jgi:hypothetical protein